MKAIKTVVIIAALLGINAAYAIVWYVHPDSALNSIQAALDTCVDDDTVLVGPGTYYENIVWPNIQGLDLISEYGSDTTIIDGDSSSSVIKIENTVSPTIVIDGFTIRNGGYWGGIYCRNTSSAITIIGNEIIASHGPGIRCINSSPIINENMIAFNESGDMGGGIYCDNSSSPSITYNTITENTANTKGGGIACRTSSSPVIEYNTISFNTAYNGGGIYCYNAAPAITSNEITGNTTDSDGAGIYCYESSPIITNNTINGNTGVTSAFGGGIGCSQNSTPTITGNTITGNSARGGAGVFCCHYSSPTIDSNTISGNIAEFWGGGVGCGKNSAPTITSNSIIDNIVAGDHQYGGGGIYCYENSAPTITDNIISGNNADSSYGGGISCDESSPLISNNTITYNSAEFVGGIRCYNNSSPVISENIITDNTATYSQAGGIYCGPNSSPTIINNTISENITNTFGGGIFCCESSAMISDNTITNNTASSAGGIFCTSSAPTITDNTITGNTANSNGGGIDCRSNSSPTIKYNVITGNTATSYGSAIYCSESAPIVISNTVTNNVGSSYGGAICCQWSSSPTIDSCTISSNNGDGVLCQYGSGPVINNSNITDNTGYGVRNYDNSLIVNANYNWWGDPAGPGGVGPGNGDEVSLWVSYEPYRFHPVGEEEYYICGLITDQYNGQPISDIITDLYNTMGDTLLISTMTDNEGYYEFSYYVVENDTHWLHEGEEYSVWMILPEGYSTHDVTSKNAVVPDTVNFTAYVQGGSYARSMGYWKHQVNTVLKGKVHDYTETDLLDFLDVIHNKWAYFDNVLTLEDMKDVFTVNQGGTMADRAAQQLLALELNVVSDKVHENATTDLGELSDAGTVGESILECEDVLLDSNSTDEDYERAKDIAEMLNKMEGFVGGGPQSRDVSPFPTSFELSQNYPNPFCSMTYISYTLSKRAHVILKIYNAAGQLVNILLDRVLEPGYYTIEWDKKDRFGHQVPTGIYFYRFSGDEFISVKKMTIVH